MTRTFQHGKFTYPVGAENLIYLTRPGGTRYKATGASLSPDAVLLRIDRSGQRFQRRRCVEETASMVILVDYSGDDAFSANRSQVY